MGTVNIAGQRGIVVTETTPFGGTIDPDNDIIGVARIAVIINTSAVDGANNVSVHGVSHHGPTFGLAPCDSDDGAVLSADAVSTSYCTLISTGTTVVYIILQIDLT